jgi:hypothetical protein
VEQKIDQGDVEGLRQRISKEIIFGPIFVELGETPSSGNRESGGPGSKIDDAIWQGNKFRDLIDLLRRAGSSEARWVVLARWLRQEKICEPEDFLPKEVSFHALTQELWKGTRRQDFIHMSLVEAWLPYFQKLLVDIKALKQQGVRRSDDQLEKKGYDRDAVVIAKNEASPFEAVYSWLESKRKGKMHTFRNAYSRARALKNLSPDAARRIFKQELEELARQGRTVGFLTRSHSSRRTRTKKSR